MLSADDIYDKLVDEAASVVGMGLASGAIGFVVEFAGGNRRTDYVSVSNTVIGVMLLVMSLGGTTASLTSLATIVLLSDQIDPTASLRDGAGEITQTLF